MHAYDANPLQGPQDLEFLCGLPLIAAPAAPCTACLPMAALAVAFEERIAGCRRGDGHVGGFSVNFHSPETVRGKRSNPIFLGGCTGERSEHAGGGDGGGGGEEGEDLWEERLVSSRRLPRLERRCLRASRLEDALRCIRPELT